MSLTSNSLLTFRRNLWTMADNNANNFYTFAAKSTPWPDEQQPPNPDNSVDELEYTVPNQIIFGKYVAPGYSSLMTTRYNWTSGTVYAQFDDADPDLYTKAFFVLTQEAGAYHVFKCLNNNNGTQSTHQPLLAETAADEIYYATADGYQWKYMYSFDQTAYNKFVTGAYIPVVANSAVTGNATAGSIETYTVDSPGSNYNSSANGYFQEIAVGGNNQFFGIQGTGTVTLTVSANAYTSGETVTQVYGGVTANGVVVSSVSANSTASVLTLRSVNNIFAPSVNTIHGSTSGKISTVIDVTSPDSSSNSNFYNGCSLYIVSGTGAGQLGTIEEYVVVGNARRVLMANAFVTTPDYTSKYLISPSVNITGDGTGAKALSVVDPNTKQISSIRVINTGSGYTYANVAIVGNTGSTAVAANNAVVRAIMSPRGGHGYDINSELNAQYICYSTTFANNENGKIPGTGSTYRTVGLIVDPQYANVLVAFSNTTLAPFSVGDTLTGSVSKAKGIIKNTYFANSTLKLSNTTGIFTSSDVLTSYYANGVLNVNTSSNAMATVVTGAPLTFDNRTRLVCPTSSLNGGTFAVNEKIVQVVGGIDVGYGYIQEMDSTVQIPYTYSAGAPNIPVTGYVVGQTSGANGNISNSGSNTLFLSNVTGTFQTSEVLVGYYQNGASAFNSSNGVTSTSVISDTYIYLTEVKGNIQASDLPSNTYKYITDDATRTVTIEVDNVIVSDMVPYTGDILYIQNMTAVTRDTSQNETVKLIYGFA